MSLLIWLPLNNENQLTSQGLMNNTFNKASSPVYNSSGKIGGCYEFDGTDDNLYSETDKAKYWNGKEISFACWFKCDKVKSGGTIIEIGADLCLSYTYNSSGVRFGYWRCYSNNGSRAGDSQADSHYYSADIWHHIAITFNHQYNKIYVDGNLSAEWDRSSIYTTNWSAMLANNNYKNIAIGRSYGSTSFIGGLINDVRIYDHCLSKKEVKEISKALVLHYKLDDISSAYQTLEYIQSSGTQWINTNWHPTSDFSVNTKVYIDNITSTGESGIFGNYTSGKGVAFGYYNKKIYWGAYTTNGWKNLTQLPITSNTVTIQYNASQTLSSLITSEGSTSSTTILYTFNDTTNPCFIFKPRYSDNGVPFVGKVYYLNIIENNSIVRDFIPVKRKSDNAIGMYDLVTNTFFENSGTGTFTAGPEIGRSNIVFDNSGYNHDGTIVGNLSVTNNTPRYKFSTYFNGSGYIKTLPGELTWTNFETLTISAWMKPTATPSSYSGSIGIGHNANAGHKTFAICNSTGKFTVNLAKGSYVFVYSDYVCPLNEWHHYAATLNGTELKMYVDGILIKTYTIDWGTAGIHENPQFQVGVDLPGTDEVFTGYYSDARIYATALSDQDIKELYDTAAYVDKNGNLECYEIYEEDLGILSTKTGLVKFDNLIEKIDSLYLPRGTWVQTDLNYENSDICKAITIIRYEANGSGRDLMGYSSSGAGYWGVTANGTWENHGITYTNSDITQINTVVYQFSSSAEHGVYTIGALGSYYSVRNKYIYNVKLYKNGILERDLVPAKNETTCGLLDIMSGTFYPCNASNGVLSTNDVETKMFKNHLESNQFLEI